MTTEKIVLKSKLDPSVNIFENGFETRFVHRPDKAIIYLSSFKGCDRSCRMCHLTQTGQTDMTPATLEDFEKQAIESLEQAAVFFKDKEQPKFVHFNFMARGEPFLNKTVMDDWTTLSNKLLELGIKFFPSSEIKFKISTIMTGIYEYNDDGTIISGYSSLPFTANKPEIYYSLYSMDPEFRKRWLPKAEEPHEMLRILSRYVTTGGKVRFHGAFIFGHNDDLVEVQKMVQAINFFGLRGKFNIVRFNSPDETRWIEATEESLQDIKQYLESKKFDVKIVDRVGTDVAASCGTFLTS